MDPRLLSSVEMTAKCFRRGLTQGRHRVAEACPTLSEALILFARPSLYAASSRLLFKGLHPTRLGSPTFSLSHFSLLCNTSSHYHHGQHTVTLHSTPLAALPQRETDSLARRKRTRFVVRYAQLQHSSSSLPTRGVPSHWITWPSGACCQPVRPQHGDGNELPLELADEGS